MTMHFLAKNVKVDDQMNVFLVVCFEDAQGDRVALQRAYRFDGDHVCMGQPYFFHYHGRWPEPDHLDWGGPGIVRSLELQRGKVVVTLDDTVARHPRGVSAFEVEFDLPDERFAQLRIAMSRCFDEFDWYVDHAA